MQAVDETLLGLLTRALVELLKSATVRPPENTSLPVSKSHSVRRKGVRTNRLRTGAVYDILYIVVALNGGAKEPYENSPKHRLPRRGNLTGHSPVCPHAGVFGVWAKKFIIQPAPT